MAAWIPARATASARSAAACASSSVDTSGASAARASSVAVTARSFSCSANNASSSGCTSPPLSDLVPRVALAELVEYAAFLRNQGRLPLGALERELVIELLQLPLEPPGFHPVHRELVHLIGIPTPEAFCFELLVGAGGGVVERQHRVVRDALEDGAIGWELELFGVHSLRDSGLPRFAFQHEKQKGLIGVCRERGAGSGTLRPAGREPLPAPRSQDVALQHILPHAGGF